MISLILVFTPLGFVYLFDIVRQYLIKPQFLHDIDEEYHAYAMEEEYLRRKLKIVQTNGKSFTHVSLISASQTSPIYDQGLSNVVRLRNGELQSTLGTSLTEIESKRTHLG